MQRAITTAVRRYSSAAKGGHDHAASEKLWKNLSLFVAFPAIAVCMANTYITEKEHMAHFHRPEFVKYDYLRMMVKKYPWGDGQRTLFHNPKVNTLPDGTWEEE